ncbi:penicillin acylase family protein [Aegicerativicinus sediminis]
MKLFKILLSFALAVAVFWLLNNKIGTAPPLGKFFNPNTGFYQNEANIDFYTLPQEQLQDSVNVYYDEHLIPHIFAKTNHDLYFAQGYVTAQNRLWQMEFQTHSAAGRISEIIGEAALEYDRGQRRKGLEFGAEKALEIITKDTETTAYLEAYKDGVNAYINGLSSANYPIEYKLLDYQPEPWTIKKTALFLMNMTDMLAGKDKDMEYTNVINLLGKERFDFLYPDFFEGMDPVIPQGTEWNFENVETPEVPEDYFYQDTIKAVMEKPHPDNGSNNWAVSPNKSKTGNAILANDPHLSLKLPSIWYIMQLHGPNSNAMGATLPGALGIISGFNTHIAWGETNATRDVRDWYSIEFKDPKKDFYKYEGEWLPTTKRIETIKVKNGKIFNDTVVYTHHGPVAYDDTFKADNPLKGYALKWTAHLGGNMQKTFIGLNESKNYADYVKAISGFVAPAQNFVFASTEGDIAIWVQGKFPNKWKGQGKFLMDGSKKSNEWQGFIPQEYNAHIKNPERGFVSSANQTPVDSSYPYFVFNDGYDTYRSRVINNFFNSKDKFDIDDFKNLQSNNFNLKAKELIPTMVKALDSMELSETENSYLEVVKNWDYYNNIDSPGATISTIWEQNVSKLMLDEYLNSEEPMSTPFAFKIVELLKYYSNDPLMDIQETEKIETAPDLFKLAFEKTIQEVETFKSEHGTYNWGEYKGTYIGHLLRDLPAFSRFNVPIGGDKSIVNATSKNHGASWRMIVEMSTPPKALGIYPGGQSGNPGSSHYDDMIDSWAKGDYLDLDFIQSEEDVNPSYNILTLKPQNE